MLNFVYAVPFVYCLGVSEIESMSILKTPTLAKLGGPVELIRAFGGKPAYEKALAELEHALYHPDQIA